MFQLNVSRKTTSLIQVWGCVVLAVACVFLCFAPMITLDTGANSSEILEAINEVLSETDADLEIPDQVEVTAPKLIGSISLVIDIVKLAKDTTEKVTTPTDGDLIDAAIDGTLTEDMLEDAAENAEKNEEANKKAAEEAEKKLKELLNSEEGKNTLIMVFALVNAITNTIGDDSNEGIISMILSVLVVIIALLYVLIFTLIFPVVFVITALMIVIPALTKMKDPCAAAPKVAKRLPGLIALPMMFILFQCVIPGMNYGSGALWLFILTAVCAVLNFVASRLRSYSNKEVLYLTVVQGGALLGAIGYLVFFFNITKTGIFNTFVRGSWGAHVASVTAQKSAEKKLAEAAARYGQEYTPTDFNNAYIVDGVMIILYLILVMASIGYFASCAQRFAAAAARNKKTGNTSDNGIVAAVFNVIACALPMYVAKTENLFTNFVDDAAGAKGSLALSGDAKDFLSVALVGAIIALAAEIAIVVLRKVLCNDLSKDERVAVITGAAKTPDEVLAEAEEIVAKAAAATAEAEPAVEVNATVEDAPAKAEETAEAPAEEN